ncbi:unnamed protein product [Clonostachys solani]|uniref:Uncharacterized protein n=1 Tax=Clonostachys solani TaxID=160281 RepID=A0A9N9W521_9HYPO|nr:unnamed protein product [Clonostachys solani]
MKPWDFYWALTDASRWRAAWIRKVLTMITLRAAVDARTSTGAGSTIRGILESQGSDSWQRGSPVDNSIGTPPNEAKITGLTAMHGNEVTHRG